MNAQKGQKFQPTVERRDFYPSFLEPLKAEETDWKARKKRLSMTQRAAQDRSIAHLKARVHNAEPRAFRDTLVVMGGVLGGVALGSMLGGAWTKAWLFGLRSSSDVDAVLIPGAAAASVFLAFQGAASIGWLAASVDTNKRQANELVMKQYQEWTRSVKVQDEVLLDALLPRYAQPNPYDPSEDEFQFVVGEHYGTEGHKYSNEAQWYGIPFEGLVTGGTVCFGMSGTGKTASVLKNFMRQVMSWKADVDYDGSGRGMEKCAGLYLDPKGNFAPEVRAVLVAAGMDPVYEMDGFDDQRAKIMSPLPYGRHAVATQAQRAANFENQRATRMNRRVTSWLVAARGYAEKLQSFPPLERFRQRILERATHEIDRRERQLKDERHKHLMGAFRSKGRLGYRTSRNPKARPFRGREKDYLELGFDDFRVNRIIAAHNRIQSASRELSNRIIAGRVEKTTVKLASDTSVNATGRELIPLPSSFASNHKEWSPRGESGRRIYLEELLRQFLASIEELMAGVFIASRTHQQVTRGSINATRVFELLAGVPGTAVGDADDMEAYADLRELVRSLAPTKDRPGEDVRGYRVRWMERESGASAFSNNMHSLLENARTALRQLEWHGGTYGELRPIIGDFKTFIDLMQMSLRTALGNAAMETEAEYGRGKVQVNPFLKAELHRIESYLPPSAMADLKRGNMLSFRMVESSLPSPRPKTEAEIKALGPRYAAPDPVTEVIESIRGLREHEIAIGADLSHWIEEVLKAGFATTELMNSDVDDLCRRIEEHFGNAPGRNDRLRSVVRRGFDLLISDLMDLLPRHLGEAYAAWLLAHPGRSSKDRTDGVTHESCSLTYANADIEQMKIEFMEILRNASTHVLNKETNFNTHIHGAGPLLGILEGRYATNESAQALCETVIKAANPASVSLVRNMLTHLVSQVANFVISIIHREWASGTTLGTVGPNKQLEARVRDGWRRGAKIMSEVVACYRKGVMWNLADDMQMKKKWDVELASSRGSAIGTEPVSDWESSLMFVPVPYRSFWRGVPPAEVYPVAALASFDPTWSVVFWKRLLLSMQTVSTESSQNGIEVWGIVRDFTGQIADYHQATVDAFSYYVAPNAGHKTDGPFCFNPVYLPGLAITNVANTFTKAVFGAMNKGGKSDPYWENAGGELVLNLLNATKLLYGYATFPILSRLIANKESLKGVITKLEEKRKQRLLRSDQLLDVANILGWYYGRWETPGAGKGETKVNIQSTLAVVTNAFLDPGYQIAFAPQRLADVSFPGWEWIFRHGKVVGVNLPIEKHQSVTPVVLALLNKSFQKYAQMRDQARVDNDRLLAMDPKNPTGRLRIKDLVTAREVVLKKIDERKEWREALGEWDRNLSGGMPMDSRESLLHKLLPGSSGIGHDREPISETIHTLFFRRNVVLDSGFAFCLGMLGPEKSGFGRKECEQADFKPAAESAYRTGVLLRMMSTISPLPWPKEVWRDGRLLEMGEVHSLWRPDKPETAMWRPGSPAMQAVEVFLAQADHAVELLRTSGHRDILRMAKLAGGPEAFKTFFRQLPAALVLARNVFFAHSIQERLSQEKSTIQAELTDPRGPGQVGIDAGGGLSLIAKARDLTDEIRRIEDSIEMMPNTSRYVVWCVDECHFYLEGDTDAQYASVSRSARMINMIACQGPSSIYSKMDEPVADALLINFPNRIIFRQGDAEEAESCANLLGGKKRVEVVDRSITQSFDELHGAGAEGRGTAAGGSVQYSVKEEERYVVDPSLLTELPAFQAVAVSWDGFDPLPAKKIWVKPDFLFMDPRIRRFNPDDPPKRSKEIPSCFPRGTDLFGMTALRLLQLGVYGSRSKKVKKE